MAKVQFTKSTGNEFILVKSADFIEIVASVIPCDNGSSYVARLHRTVPTADAVNPQPARSCLHHEKWLRQNQPDGEPWSSGNSALG